MTQLVFNRYEKKYLLPEPVYLELRSLLEEHMTADQFGLSTICNIYYDTEDDLLIRRSIEHPVYKEKLRLRSYGTPGRHSGVFLEIKKKYDHIVNKRRIELPLHEAYKYLDHGIRPGRSSQILNETDFFLARYPLRPKLYLAYERIAFYGNQDPEFRVTFDSRIRSRRTNIRLEQGDFGRLLLPESWYLMEIKVSQAVPKWFSEILAGLHIYSSSFSKYGNIYRKEHDAWDVEAFMSHRFTEMKNDSFSDPHQLQRYRRKMIC